MNVRLRLLTALLAPLLASLSIPAAGAEEKKPNLLLILADDMGYSDVGVLGGEIPTPSIDALASSGVLFTNFHVAGTCSPTRSMLMTGVDNHRVGYGNMEEILADNQVGKPGYEGRLNGRVPTVAARLREAGYDTYVAGKWHLGKTKDSIPAAQGFSRSLALMESGADHWENKVYLPVYERNHFYSGEKEVQPPAEYYSSTLYVDELIRFVEADAATGKPFFAYLAFQAPHYPHQAPDALIEKNLALYEKGWDAVRKARFDRLVKLGVVAPDAAYRPAAGVPAWDGLAPAARRDLAKRMAVYAAMVEAMDLEIGRLVAFLKKTGRYDDTVIFFLSDNGPDATEVEKMFPDFYRRTYDQSYESLGRKGAFSSYGPGWAAVSATPFSNSKGSASEGGLRAPLIVSWPGHFESGVRTSAFGFVTDIVPTLLALAGVTGEADELPGRSLVPLLRGTADVVHGPRDLTVYELAGSRAVFQGDYKLVMDFPPYGDAKWRLFDYVDDPSESTDLTTTQPERAASLRKAYEDYAKRNGFVEVPPDYTTVSQMAKNTARAAAARGSSKAAEPAP